MRAFKKPGGCVGTHVQGIRYDLCPGHAIGGHIRSEQGPNSRQLHPGVGERVCSTAGGPVKVVLDLKAASSRSDCDQDIRATRGSRLLEHNPGLRIGAGVRLRCDARDECSIAVHRLVDIIELVISSVDVGTRAVHREHAICIACRAADCRGTNIGVDPGSRKRTGRRGRCLSCDLNVIKGCAAILPDIMRSHEQPDGCIAVHGDARRTNLCPRVSVRGFPRSEGIASSLQLEPFVGGAEASEVRGRLRASEIVLHTHTVADGRCDRREWTGTAIDSIPHAVDIRSARTNIWRDQRIHVR